MGDIWIWGGTVVTADGERAADVVVRDGRIEEVVHRGEGRPEAAALTAWREAGRPELDGTGKLVLPGLVDVHVHFRQPGLEHKEDFASGTLAAACGGVTTVLDMPNTIPPVASAETLREKSGAVAGQAHVDYGLYAVIDEHNLDELPALVEAGAAAFKLFLGPTTGDLRAPGWGRLMDVFRVVKELGLPLAVHAEHRDVIEYGTAQVLATVPSLNYDAFLATRPRFGEVAATQTLCLLAQMTGTPVHIAHVTLAESVEVIRQAKAAGAPVTAETCPPYLTMTAADCEALGPVSKILPPIRRQRDQEALWAGLHDGTIDIIATDHAPHEAEAKTGGWLEAAGGMIGVETMLPVLLNEVAGGRLTLSELVRWTSTAPARIFGLNRKGDLRPGMDGDVVVVDRTKSGLVTALHSKSSNSPLFGRPLQGSVVHTVLRGHLVVVDGEPTGAAVGEPVGSQR